jgi:hypothetical protein
MVDGDVLELGAGIYSTLLLHWVCFDSNRLLVTYENYERYYNMVKHCESELHKVILVERWDDADIERDWGVVLVDHAPAIRRKDDIKRLADYAKVIVVHDSQGRARKHYHYEEVYPLFKYKCGYAKSLPHSVILSNFVDMDGWF